MDKKLFLIVPIENEFAAFGLVNKYNAPKTILSTRYTHNAVVVKVPEGGIFAAYSAQKPAGIRINGNPVTTSAIRYDKDLLMLTIIESSEEIVIEIGF